MNRVVIFLSLVAAFLLARPALADTVTTYDINFTSTNVGVLPTGSFTYDSTTSTFLSFYVIADGQAFNMTSAFNSAGAVTGNCPAANAITFLTLDGNCGTPNTTATWDYFLSTSVGMPTFFAFGEPNGGIGFDGEISKTGAVVTVPVVNSGHFSLTAVTPEPSSLTLLGTGLAAAAIFLRRRRISLL